VIGLDTNVLARYYIEDAGDLESRRQREAARRLIEGGAPLMVAKTVLLELEWVMRGYYGFDREQIQAAFGHLLSLPQLQVEDRELLGRAVSHYRDGVDFADALHHATYAACASVASFDETFARKSKRLGLVPSVAVPS
jgi:predicted nucleic-acid-binding protein